MGAHLDLDDVAANNPLAMRELAELRRDAERYRWLRNYYGSVDFEPADHDGMDLVFSVPQGEVSADCDKTIDGLMQGANEQ